MAALNAWLVVPVHAAEPQLGTRIVHPIDAAVMAYVPAGEFVMGMDQKEADQVARDLGFKDYTDLWAWETFPKHTVFVAGFFVDVHEVTVERWRVRRGASGVGEDPRGTDEPVGQARRSAACRGRDLLGAGAAVRQLV